VRRALSITLLAAAAVAAATSASAQQVPARARDDGHSLGLRYLTWPGRTTTARTTPEQPAATPVRRPAATAPLPAQPRRPTPAIIPHGVPAESASTGPASAPGRGLTPANAWMTPAVVTSASPPPSSPRPAPVPTAAPAVTAPPVVPLAADPMAPRRDALIFHLTGAEGAPAAAPARSGPQAAPPAARSPVVASDTGPAEQGARYYSVHRQNNRQPDPTPLPATSYVDAIAVDLPASLASQDLAAPPEPPTLVRNAQGRLQAMPDTSTPDQL
jgi:hypothetical protein